MKKEILKKKLLRVFKMEENAAAIYLDHISSIITVFSHHEKAMKEVQEIQQMVIKSSHHHRNTCQNLLSYLEMDKKNDY